MHAQFSDKKHKELSNSTYVSYYKLPYIEHLSTEIKQKLSNIANIIVKVLISKLSFPCLKFRHATFPDCCGIPDLQQKNYDSPD